MKIKFLGTAAAEAIPALYCDCDACKNARKYGGKDIRTRSQAILDDKILIDFPADTYFHAIKNKINLSKISSLLITHSHSDHLIPTELAMRTPNMAHLDNEFPLNVYVGKSGKELIERDCKLALNANRLKLFEIEGFKPFTVEDYKITPIPASHDEASTPFIFIIEKDGKTLLYGNDTGVLRKDVLEKFLSLNVKFDLLSLDCTMGEIDPGYEGHFNLREDLEFIGILKQNGKLKENCKFVITHFTHNAYISHKYLYNKVKKYGIKVAYDGFTVKF